MRQRASTKTQRRLKQQQMGSPYALTDDVYCETPSFHIGGLVTAAGVLQLVVALALCGFVCSGALLFSAVLLVTLGVTLLHHSNTKVGKQGLGLKQAINRVLALRRSALDYSLTLSIAQSDEYKQTQSKELQIAVVPSSPTPPKVVATMALKDEEEARRTRQNRTTRPLADVGSFVTLNRVKMMPLPTIRLLSTETTEGLIMEKPRANSEPKQVLRSRPLLPLTVKMQNIGPMQEERPTSPVLKTLAKQAQAKPTQSQQKKASVSAKKPIQLPAVLPKTDVKVAILAVLPITDPVIELPKPELVEVVSVNAKPVASAVEPLPVLPEHKLLMQVAHGEAAIERDLVVTRRVLLYLKPTVNSEKLDLEKETESEQDFEPENEPEDFALSLEAFPPLSPPMMPQVSMTLPTTDVVEPNFLMYIELEPLFKPENQLVTPSSLHLESVGNVDLRSMLDELDAMSLELEAAMECCTLLLHEGKKLS